MSVSAFRTRSCHLSAHAWVVDAALWPLSIFLLSRRSRLHNLSLQKLLIATMMYFGSVDHPDFLISLSQFCSLFLQAHCLKLLLDALLFEFVFILPQVFLDEFINSHFVDLILRNRLLVWLIDVRTFRFWDHLLICNLHLASLVAWWNACCWRILSQWKLIVICFRLRMRMGLPLSGFEPSCARHLCHSRASISSSAWLLSVTHPRV